MATDEADTPEPSDSAEEEERGTLEEPRVEDEGGDEQTDPVPDA